MTFSSSETTLPTLTEHGKPATKNSALPGWVKAVVVLVIGAAMCASVWIYYEGSTLVQTFRDSPDLRSASNGQLLRMVERWRALTPLGVLAFGIVAAAMTVKSIRHGQREAAKRFKTNASEWTTAFTALRAQLSEKTAMESQHVRARQELETQVTTLSRSNAQMLEELNRRKEAEKALSQQRLELTRSKDVLELHVQARTQELQKLQRQYEQILNSAGEGICGVDPSGKITFVNPTAASLMGWTVEEMVGQLEPQVFSFVNKNGDTETLNAGDTSPREVILKRLDGSRFAAEYVRSPIRENGRAFGNVVLFKDITERKQTDEALARKAAELARSNAELEQFAFVASHDLQEPLRKIQAFGDRLKAKCETVESTEARDYLTRMQSAAERMQTLINDLLTFSRVIRSSQPFVPVDLNAVTKEVLSDLEVRIEKCNAQIQLGELPTIDADPTQMRQLMQNLVSNALKFQPPNAVPVVKIEARIVDRPAVWSAKSGNAPVGGTGSYSRLCEITVQDNGIGFDEKYLDKIFAVFQRLHGRTEYEGTGVGLAVCRRITDRHGGNIVAKSKPGEGATFVVTLPLHQPKPQNT